MGKAREDLTDQEKKFADLKVSGKTHADAVVEAGYHPSTRASANAMGVNLYKKPIIQNRIDELRKAEARKLMEKMPDLIKEMVDLAMGKTVERGSRVHFEAVRDLMDRIPGLGKKEKIQLTDEHFPAELLKLLNRLNINEGEA